MVEVLQFVAVVQVDLLQRFELRTQNHRQIVTYVMFVYTIIPYANRVVEVLQFVEASSDS